MSVSYDPANVILPSEQAARAIEVTLMFRRRTIWAVHIVGIGLGLALLLWSATTRTALMTPVDPDYRAGLIGLGVFLGMLLAAVEREAWLLGIGDWGRRGVPKGIAAYVSMVAIIVASGFGGDFIARKSWEWQAFHGLNERGTDQVFTVIGRHSARSGEWLDLQAATDTAAISINCSHPTYLSVMPGDRLTLPVETGRGGVQRVSLPPFAAVHRP